METTIDFPHPSLGVVRGLTSSTTHRFLGLKYATLTDKWASPVISEGDPGGCVYATMLGPTVPSPPNGVEIEFGHIQKALPYPQLQQSDTECLNLNLTTPKNVSLGSNLPVIVYLHGGGYAIGANSWPQYDFRRIVDLSVRQEQPVIGVNINYRLGAFGFLTSSELVSHGYKPNNGLHDQQTALLWIKKHIIGFGGDPDNITLVGESAGGVSATHHLQSEAPLFKRMVSMSGTNLLMKPLPSEATELAYKNVVELLGLALLPASERVKTLVQMDAQKLIQAIPPTVPLLPSVGGELGVKQYTYAEIFQGPPSLPGRTWCEAIMIGNCQMDASILSTLLNGNKAGIASDFRVSLTRSLASADRASQILTSYGVTDDMPSDKAFEAILNFANDICFSLPVLHYGHCWSDQAFLYNFNEPNSWEGPWQGYANHILDVAYLFQNYNESLSESQRIVATRFAQDLIAFSYGQAPWPAFKSGSMDRYSRVYGGRSPDTSGKVMVLLSSDPRLERSKVILDLAQSIPPDELAKAWGLFMAGHS